MLKFFSQIKDAKQNRMIPFYVSISKNHTSFNAPSQCVWGEGGIGPPHTVQLEVPQRVPTNFLQGISLRIHLKGPRNSKRNMLMQNCLKQQQQQIQKPPQCPPIGTWQRIPCSIHTTEETDHCYRDGRDLRVGIYQDWHTLLISEKRAGCRSVHTLGFQVCFKIFVCTFFSGL